MIKIYTDGSCIGNPGNGGWGAIIIIDGEKTIIKGSEKNTTNNQMELLAPIKALNQITKGKSGNTNSINILVLKEKISLTFKENVDITSQKERIMLKMESLKKQIDNLNKKLKNEGYIKNAPKDIVQGDKKLVKDLTIEDAKLRSIVSSIN